MVKKPRKRAGKAVRLTFAYDQDGIRLIDRTKVQKRPPEPAPEPDVRRAGLTAELRAAGDRATYRQTIDQGLPRDVEVFDPKLTRGVYRSPEPLREGAFSIIVPDDAEAEELVLLTAPEPARRRPGAGPTFSGAPGRPVEIARFRLKD